MRKLLSTLFLFICAWPIAAQTKNFQSKFPSLDRYIDSVMKQWNIPGLALGIVYKDQLIYAKGYGYRDVENKLPVEASTLFPIASNSKLFTATAAVMLAEERKLSLDIPVKKYMPSLQFNNEELNARVTLRDLLSHRTGLPRYDGIWVGATATRKEMVEKIGLMKPQLGFREGYIYNNMMFVTAGAVMEAVDGNSWENIIKNKIFNPLQMNESRCTQAEWIQTANKAVAYFQPDSSKRLMRRTQTGQTDALGPAGTIKSTVNDMSHWMIAQLNNGMYKGEQAISSTAIQQTLVPNNIADKEMKWDELSNGLYCLGRTIQTYKGYKLWSHTGSIDGFFSNLTFVPGEQIGIFMVHNSIPAGSFRSGMALPIIDRLLGLSLTPWSDRYYSDYLQSEMIAKRQKDSLARTRVLNTNPSHALSDYTGVFYNPLYGEFTITLVNDKLAISFRNNHSVLYHFHYDQFNTNNEGTDLSDFRIQFTTNAQGKIDRFTMRPFGDPLAEFIRK
jgi:CubicO group peptidase (beta-lactamase class C family)